MGREKTDYIIDIASIIIGFLAIVLSLITSLQNLYLILGLSGALIITRYICYVVQDNNQRKHSIFGILVILYVLACLLDESNYMLFTIYFVTTTLDKSNSYKKLKVILYLLFPNTLLLLKYFLISHQGTPLELLFFISIFLLIGLIFILMEKILLEYDNANKKMNLALARAAVNELDSKRYNKELALKNLLADRNARLEEREKISMDIHNSVGHTITAAIMALDAAEVIYDTEKDMAKEKITVANTRMHESLSSIRKAVRVLNNEELRTNIEDLFHSLIQCMKQFELDTNVKIRTNIQSQMEQENQVKYIDSELGHFLYGALQELLSNGVRHGQANAFIVMVDVDEKHMKLVVQDNGKGLGTLTKLEIDRLLKNGFGLQKIRRYLNSIGGDFFYDGSDGFLVTITIPLIEVEEH